ncbi:MAG: pseudouridine synthase [Rickettsiales bacterium]
MSEIEKQPERIAKRIARAGVCSRREAEKLIEAGRVLVNDKKITSPALNVSETDKIEVNGELLAGKEKTRLWLYHKPTGLVTTHKDPQGRPTVFAALPKSMPRVISVGRLDLNSEGLLLLTNDGELARKLELPATGWKRRYRVRAHGVLNKGVLAAMQKGVTVEGIKYGSVEAVIDKKQGGNSWLTVSLTEGKNREIRKIFDHFNCKVNRLIRLSYGPFVLGSLPKGDVKEVPEKTLKSFVKI